jgi:hypothetical protein
VIGPLGARQFQISNLILQIAMESTSSVWPNAMVYDDNLAFGFFELEPPPQQSIDLVLTPNAYGNNGSNYLIDAVYSLFVDVTLNYSTIQYQLQ